ncbi:hypothetical protein N9971_00250 [bacterium]|nr:hypothetical protein [bacterium]
MKVRTVIATCALVGALLAPTVFAQDSEAPEGQAPEEAQDPAAPAATPDDSEKPKEKKKIPFGLYVYAGFGGGDPNEFNTSLVTTSTANSENTVDIDGVTYARAAIGWQLANKKGDFRLVFDGFSENDYTYESIGRSSSLPSSGPGNTVLEPLVWWNTTIEDGTLRSIKKPPQWTLDDDSNGDLAVSQDEVRYPTDEECMADPSLGCRDITKNVTDNLQNRFQNYDILYGRVWGPRRFQGRWFAGLRYMTYEGNLLSSAWLDTTTPGLGYTDGTFLRMINFSQKMTGIGPTGLLEARWNFFGQRLQVYLNGQVAFLLADLEVDSGQFFTLVTVSNPQSVVPIPARLDEKRDKSIWNTKAEAGLRYIFKAGLELELAYMYQGYLDAILNPERIQIPGDSGEAAQGISAVYNTQDITLGAWRFGVGFQF